MTGDGKRADPFGDIGDLDLSDFAPAPVKKPPPAAREVVKRVSEAANFPSRTASKPAAPEISAPATPPQPEPKKPPLRHRTYRNTQFNAKVTAEVKRAYEEQILRTGLASGELFELALPFAARPARSASC